MAMTACKTGEQRHLLVGEGADLLPIDGEMTPVSSLSLSIGTPTAVRTPPSSTDSTTDGWRSA
jgi:hypothetical protein